MNNNKYIYGMNYGRQFEGRQFEGRQFEGRQFEGRKFEGRQYEGKRPFEGQRSFEGQRPFDEERPFEGRLNTLTEKLRNKFGNNNNVHNTHHHSINNISNDQNSHTLNIYAKQQLINYIYSTVELSNFKYKVIEYEHELPLLVKQRHFVSANFSGSNCLLIFVKILNKFYSYLIDRKTLSYNQHQVVLETVKIYPVTVRLDNSIYDGSIFDGILINNSQGQGQQQERTFVITDVYIFRGRNMSVDKIQYKIMNLVAYLKANFKDDDKMNNLKLTVNKLYEPEKIESLIKDIPNMKNYNIKGLAFYPETSGTKLIFMLDNDNRSARQEIKPMQIKTDRPHNIGNKMDMSDKSNIGDKSNTGDKSNMSNKSDEYQDNKKTNIRYVCRTDDPVYATFELKKTKDTDVYKLYLVETVKRDNKIVLKSKKMGIAFIPSTTCSVMCREVFSKNISSRVLMKCRFVSDKNKWEPIDIDSTAKYPTNISEVEKNLEILEEFVQSEEEQ